MRPPAPPTAIRSAAPLRVPARHGAVTRRRAAAALCAALALAGAGCTEDPLDRPGTWRPTGANDANLRAMIARPDDLARGSGTTLGRGQAGSAPVTALEQGRRPAVPTTQLEPIGRTSTTGAGGPGFGDAR
jgi:hypothetical protein